MIIATNINDAFIKLYNEVADVGQVITARGLKTKELVNQTVRILYPNDRIVTAKARKASPYYIVGETIWYLGGSNLTKDIAYYSGFWNHITDDGVHANSAYGYLIKHASGFNQLDWCIEELRNDPASRKAVISLKHPQQNTKDTICTNSIQFLLRNGRLNMYVHMRSNDIVKGFTYDAYFFSLLQEIVADALGVPMGIYEHTAVSMHVYEPDWGMEFDYTDLRQDKSAKFNTIGFLEDLPRLMLIESYLRNLQPTDEIDYDMIDDALQQVKSGKAKEFIIVLVLQRLRKNKNEIAFRTFLGIYENSISIPMYQLIKQTK